MYSVSVKQQLGGGKVSNFNLKPLRISSLLFEDYALVEISF